MVAPHGTDGSEAEKLGNLEGFGAGLVGNSFARVSFCPMDEVRVLASRVSATPMLASVSDAFLGGSGGPGTCD